MRAEMRARCLRVDPETAERAAASVAAHLAASSEYRRAARLVLYAELAGEIPIGPIAERARRDGKAVLWPRLRPDGGLDLVPGGRIEELVPGRHGVREPAAGLPGAALVPGDLVLVPGLAFDARGGRLGRGGGAWDRSLGHAVEAVGAVAFGIGYEFQVVPAVPREAHDRPVAALLTECGIRRSHEE